MPRNSSAHPLFTVVSTLNSHSHLTALSSPVAVMLSQPSVGSPVHVAPSNTPSQHRTALCIGNSAYPGFAYLRNPGNDATDFAAYLDRRLAFQVNIECDANKESMESAFERFIANIQPGTVVVLYFAGHACEVGGINYLLPIMDCGAMSDADIRYRGVSAQWMQEKVWERRPAFLLFILDCCRDSPYRGTRSIGGHRGLAHMEPLGSLLLYACAPGGTAQDSVDGSRTSPLITNLMQHLHVGEVHSAIRQVAGAVYASTKQRQRPWTHTDMLQDFYLTEPAPSAHPISTSPQPPSSSSAAAIAATPHVSHSTSDTVSTEPASSSAPPPVEVSVSRLLDQLAVHKQRREVSSIVALMEQYPSVTNLQYQACMVLGFLANDEASRQRIVSVGGIEAVVAAMRQHAMYNLQLCACMTLVCCACDEPGCQLILKAGGVECVVSAMKQNALGVRLQRFGSEALGKLARDESSFSHSVLVAAIERIVAAMRMYEELPAMQEYACFALARFTHHMSGLQYIASAGGVESIMTAIKRHTADSSVLQHACEVLVVVARDEANCQRIVSAGGIEAIVAAMKQQVVSVGRLRYWPSVMLTSLARDESTRYRIVTAGGLELLQQARHIFKDIGR